MSARDLIVASGDDARTINEKKTSDAKVRFLKGGKPFRGRFLTTKFDTFVQHGDFEKRIQSHMCLDPKGRTNCPSCKAGVKRTLKTLVPFWDVDTGEIVVRDVAKSNMEAIYKALDTYGDDLLTDTYEISTNDKGAFSIMFLKPKKGEPEFPITPDTLLEKGELPDDVMSHSMNLFTETEIIELLRGKLDAVENVEIKRTEATADTDKF